MYSGQRRDKEAADEFLLNFFPLSGHLKGLLFFALSAFSSFFLHFLSFVVLFSFHLFKKKTKEKLMYSGQRRDKETADEFLLNLFPLSRHLKGLLLLCAFLFFLPSFPLFLLSSFLSTFIKKENRRICLKGLLFLVSFFAIFGFFSSFISFGFLFFGFSFRFKKRKDGKALITVF